MLRGAGTAIPTSVNFRYDVTGNNLINTSDVGVVRGLGTLTLLGLPEPTVPPPPRGGNPLQAEAVADAAASLDAREFPPLVRQSLGEQRRFSDKWFGDDAAYSPSATGIGTRGPRWSTCFFTPLNPRLNDAPTRVSQ